MAVLDWIRTRFGLAPGEATWPPEELAHVWREIERFIAFRESDETILRQQQQIPWWDRYLISPVPRMISRANANLLFGEAPEISAADEADQEALDFIVDENDLPAELHRAAVISSSEGEIWGRLCIRPDLLDVPVIEFVSRRNVIPHFAGRFVLGATFVTEWLRGEIEVYRLFESYDPGSIECKLFYGTRTSLGVEVALSSFEPTQNMAEIVYTGVDEPLVAFIPNSIDSNPARGYSDYCGLEERFYSINRATTIGDSNTEIAGKKRGLLDAEYTSPGGRVLSGDDIYIRDSKSGDLGEAGPFQVLEYSYDAQQITVWLDHLIDSTLTFGGSSPQLVGRASDQAAISGTALRYKMIHSLLESSGKGRYFDRGTARLLRFAQILDSRPTTEVGFGRGWTKADERPSIVRSDGLPTDDLEAAQRLQLEVGAQAISVEERVAFLHPDWTQDQRDEEVKLLKAEAQAQQVALPGVRVGA